MPELSWSKVERGILNDFRVQAPPLEEQDVIEDVSIGSQ